LMIGRY
ncbi:metallo-beta-lactamase superfamily protein, partial [Vibrio parahaemolyticus V-223/04]